MLANGTALPRDFQTWQMNEVNKLIWPSENGILNLTDDMFDQTADILFEYGVIETEATKRRLRHLVPGQGGDRAVR